MQTTRLVCLSAAFLYLAGAPLHAQTRIVTGLAIDSASTKPLAQAMIYVDAASAMVRTGKDGIFRYSVTTGGETPLVVRHSGYVPVRVIVPDAESPVGLGKITLRKVATPDDQTAVDEEDLRLYPQLGDFFGRKKTKPQGVFFGPDEIGGDPGRRPTDVMRRGRGLRNFCVANPQGERDCGVQDKRGTTYSRFRSGESECVADIWASAGRFGGALDDILLKNILAMEVYLQRGSTPPQYARSECGAVVVWLRPTP